MSVNTDMIEELKKAACEAIDQAAADLQAVSQEIWSHPEENFQEHHAHKVQTAFLEQYGFPVERQYVLETGFRAVYGEASQPNVAVLCEYDSLPKIGHGCGHNLIAEAGLGAAVGIKAALDTAARHGQQLGRLTLLGTPAEEGGGGKIDMINGGAFKDVDLSMMVHPFNSTLILPQTTAVDMVTVTYHGKASHAAAFPWEGVNALDATVMAYTSISVLRQQLKPSWRVHGIIANGGAKPNIIPESAAVEYNIRAPTTKEVQVIKQKVEACFRAAAEATGCTVDIVWTPKPFQNLLNNRMLGGVFEKNSQKLGVTISDSTENLGGGSTDMGNVSYVVPVIHPMFGIGTDIGVHTKAFAEVAGDPKVQPFVLSQAKAMACTTIDVFTDSDLAEKISAEFKEQLKLAE